MDEERPIDQFLGFLKLIGVLVLIIVTGIGLVVGLSWYLSPEQPAEVLGIALQPEIKQFPAYVPEPVTEPASADPLDADLAVAQGEYRDAKAALEAALDSQEATPSIMQEELGVVEGAIVEIVSALAMNPENQSLRRTLLGTYQRQVELLQKTLEIAGEESGEAPPETGP